jgi:phage terminase large subunit-like protein
MPTLSASEDVQAFAAACGVTLEPFQKRIVRAVAGPEPEILVTMPRGGGKTSLTALIVLHHLITVPGAAIYVAAASRQQASLLFEYADRLRTAARAPEHRAPPPRAALVRRPGRAEGAQPQARGARR